MSAECRAITEEITEYLNSEAGIVEMQGLMRSGASAVQITEAFARIAPNPVDAMLMREEFASLPADFVTTFMTAWAVAASAGRRFTLTSEAPASPLDFARRGCVAYRIEHDERGVTMYVSHVHGRHAEWFKPAVAVA